MRSLGAVIVGIGAYRYERDRFPVLRYASKDAGEFRQYLATCWPKPNEAKVITVPEERATEDAISKAFRVVSQEGPYDLQLVFLSGHGFANSQSAGFVVQPPENSSALALLDTTTLDRLITAVPATRTILILDCCYAEGIAKRLPFFTALGDSDARLFVASSRESQLTWEDDRVGHGIFTAHLLDLLRTGNSVKLKSVRDQLDVDGELFPVLCEQVPLYVFEHKQNRQEPVKGGVSIRAITLPVARAARRIKERSVLGTVVLRIRQVITAVALVFLSFLFLSYTLAYYAEADRNGNVRLHHGTKWLAPALRFLPTLRADTGISATDLSDDPTSRYAVQAGDTDGFWTQHTQQGYRSWYDTIRPSLDRKAMARYDLLVSTRTLPPVSRLNDDSRPSDIRFAAWALLDNSESKQVSAVLAHVLGADRTSPLLTSFSANDLDFNILDLTQSELASFADALRFAAAVDPHRTFVAYLGFLKANQVWLVHSSREQHGEEAQRRAVEDVSDVLKVIAKARVDRGEAALDPTMIAQLKSLGTLGYGRLVDVALSRTVAASDVRATIVARALSAFHGDANAPAQSEALGELKDSLEPGESSKAVVAEVYNRFVAMGGPEQAYLTGFLIAAADKKALPSIIVKVLLDNAQKAVNRRKREFLDTEYARILAHGMSQVPDGSRPLVYQLIDAVTADVTPMASSTAEIYTALARLHLDKPTMFRKIIAQAAAAPPYQPQDPGVVAEPLPGLSIVVSHGFWLEALAILGQDRILDGEAIRILEAHANDPSVHEEIVRALARQPAVFTKKCWATNCGRMLGAFANDAAERQLASDVLAERLASLPRAEFLVVLESLRKEREANSEPEVRIAISLARINSQLARVRITSAGNQLFQGDAD